MFDALFESSFTKPSFNKSQDFQTDPIHTTDNDDFKLESMLGSKAVICIAKTFPASVNICFANGSPFLASSARFLQTPRTDACFSTFTNVATIQNFFDPFTQKKVKK